MMKLYLLPTLLLVGAIGFASAKSDSSLSFDSEDPLEDCLDCMEDLDDARDCLRDCADDSVVTTSGSTDSLLTQCLDESTDEGSAVSSLEDLVDCCSFDSDCERDLEDAQDCLEFCLDSCIADEAEEYLDCIRDEAERSSCDLDECIDDFLSDDLVDDLDSSLSSSNDLFSIEALERRIVRIEEEQLEDCNLLADFVDSACDIASDCCERCEEELGEFIDCLVNDIVIPFVSIELNRTIDTCPIDTENCELDLEAERESGSRKKRRAEESRPLSEQEEKLFARALALPKKSQKQSERNAKKEAIAAEFRKTMGSRRLTAYNNTEAVQACEATMRLNVVAHNMTHAMNVYTECISVAAIESLAANSPDSAATMPSVVAALAAVAGVAVAVF
jgi:hypothetical protein